MSKITSPVNVAQMPSSNFEDADRSFRVAQGKDATFSNEPLNSAASPVAAELSAANQGIAAVQGVAAVQTAAAAMQAAASQPAGTEIQSRLAQLDQQIGQFGEALRKLATNFKLVNARLESLDQRIDSVAAASESQGESTLVAGSSVDVLASKIDARFESLENIFKSQCEMVSGFLTNSATNAGDLKVKMNTAAVVETESSSAATTASVVESVDEPDSGDASEDDPAKGWQQRKQAMMAQYGGDAESIEPEDETTPADVNTSQPQADTPAADEPSASAEEATVDELKRELNSKIRDAEVEMSINRARLMQERVEFERAQSELERRAAKLEAKLAANSGGGYNTAKESEDGLMGRFKRHLGNNE